MKISVTLLFLAAFSFTNAAPEKPNVLFICVDDLKPTLGCYGDKTAKTPNIDRLAERSTLFENAYCNQAVCAPSRNSLLTGLRPDTIGIYDLGTNFRLAVPDAVTLPQTFRNNGYHTVALGKNPPHRPWQPRGCRLMVGEALEAARDPLRPERKHAKER